MVSWQINNVSLRLCRNLSTVLCVKLLNDFVLNLNGGRSMRSNTNAAKTSSPSNVSFTLVLQPTYYTRGFFNIRVANASHLGADREKIKIICGTAEKLLLGSINRRANKNGTPRIMGG